MFRPLRKHAWCFASRRINLATELIAKSRRKKLIFGLDGLAYIEEIENCLVNELIIAVAREIKRADL